MIQIQPKQLPITFKLNSGSELVCEHALRYLPGKRLVCQARLDGQQVLAKVLFSKKAIAEGHLEARSLHRLADLNIPTQVVLRKEAIVSEQQTESLQTLVENMPVEVLICQWLQGHSLKTLWYQSSPEEKTKLFTASLVLLAWHHSKGVLQTDLHMGNFLVVDEVLVTLDGDTIHFAGGQLSHKACLQQLGIWLAQVFPSDDDLTELCLPKYFELSNQTLSDEDKKNILKARQKQRRIIIDNKRPKYFRDCTAFKVEKTPDYWLVHQSTLESVAKYKEYCLLAKQQFAKFSFEDFYKDSPSATIVKDTIADKSLVIKRYNKQRPMGKLLGKMHRRARNAWLYGNILKTYGIATPDPKLLLFDKKAKRTFIVSEYIAGLNLYWLLIRTPKISDAEKNRAVLAVVELLAVLKKVHLCHGDLKQSNFIWSGEQMYMIDLDGMQEERCPCRFKKKFSKDIERFMQNFSEYPEWYQVFERQFKAAELL